MNIEQLKARKKELKMTFDELSKKSGIAKRTLEDVFLGQTRNPRIDTMQAIESALGLSDDSLPGEGDYPIHLEPEELNWLETLNRAKDTLGEKYVNGVISMLELAMQQKK